MQSKKFIQKRSGWIAVFAAGALATGALTAIASEKAHWGYSAANGPAKWSSLDPKFALCGAGRVQSPVDIPTNSPIIKTSVSTAYAARPGATVVNNGHTIQVNVPAGNQMKVNGKVYNLLQFHFHTPSENRINGTQYPMEMHMVHKSNDGALAVLAVMLRGGGSGNLIDRLPTPAKAGSQQMIKGFQVNPAKLLPGKPSHFAFTGSLTTPPCSEGVTWIVMSTPLHVGQKTIARFHKILGNNNRPVNPLNGRKITYTR